MSHDVFTVQVQDVRAEADGIKSFELVAMNDALPSFAAGAHIDLHLPNGMIRSYSLLNDPAERHRYVVAVANDLKGRGGSRYLHESVAAGDMIAVSPPRNHFPLVENAEHTILIAGGIGITPIFCMIQRLEALGRSWELYYSARARSAAALVNALANYSDRVIIRFDDETGGVPFDLAEIVGGAAPDTHIYCCGPTPMLKAFEDAGAHRPDTIHLEYFAADLAPATGAFEVRLARSGHTLAIRDGENILDALLAEGFDIPYSCQEGTCGECETRVLAGIPDHRDVVLSKKQRDSNAVMMVCCSRAKSASLTLDI